MVELKDDEKKLRYVKYFYQDLEKIPDEKIEIANGNALSKEIILDIEDRNSFLSKGIDEKDIGFGIAKNGTGYVSNKTFMKDVKVDMIDWWFAWHCIGSDLRYKLWDHDDHYYARADKVEYILDKNVPMNQKTWGVNHKILEDIGFGPSELILSFKRPADFGYDEKLLGSKYCNSMVCAIGEGDVPAFMTHKYYKVDGGTMFESKFWIGYAYINGEIVKVLPEGMEVPEIAVRNLFKHNIKEFSNLAKILPEIYREEKDNWL